MRLLFGWAVICEDFEVWGNVLWTELIFIYRVSVSQCVFDRIWYNDNFRYCKTYKSYVKRNTHVISSFIQVHLCLIFSYRSWRIIFITRYQYRIISPCSDDRSTFYKIHFGRERGNLTVKNFASFLSLRRRNPRVPKRLFCHIMHFSLVDCKCLVIFG